MRHHIGGLTVETIAPEAEKFAAALVLIHGLWGTAAIWRRFMGYLAHRGWASHAVNLRGRGDEGAIAATFLGAGFADFEADIEAVLATHRVPPVLIGHDVGGLLALRQRRHASAVIALTPLVPSALAPPTHALTGLSARLATWRRTPLPPPRGRLAKRYFAAGAPGGCVPEPWRLIRDLQREPLVIELARDVPALIMAAANDRICPPSTVARLAAHVGAEMRTAAGATHALPWETGWERQVGEVHRWLVRTLGEPLLLLRDEEDA